MTAIDGDDTLVVPSLRSEQDRISPRRASRVRRELRADQSKRRVRRFSIAALVILASIASWVSFGHLDRIDPATLSSSGGVAIISSPTTPRTTARGDSSTGPLDELGGLITGPNGLAVSSNATTIDNRLLVVGDSVMQGAAPNLSGKLPAWSVIADTKVGRFLDEATRVVKRRANRDLGDFVVLNLGNNYGGDPLVFRQQIDDMMIELARVRHVLWVNVGEFEPAQKAVNAELRSALLRYPNLVLADWSRLWEAHPEYTAGDNLHLTDSGPDAYAKLVADSVTRIVRTAGELPAKGAQKAQISTRGEIPKSKPKASRSRSSTTVDTMLQAIIDGLNSPSTTAPPSTPETTQPPVTAPAPSTSSP